MENFLLIIAFIGISVFVLYGLFYAKRRGEIEGLGGLSGCLLLIPIFFMANVVLLIITSYLREAELNSFASSLKDLPKTAVLFLSILVIDLVIFLPMLFSSKWRKGIRQILGWFSVIPLTVTGILLLFAIRDVQRVFELRPFASLLSDYLYIPNLLEANLSPYIVGKVITIDKVKNEIDYIYFDLPQKIRAINPDEVGTIIWLECRENLAATYTRGGVGYQTTCQVTIIDRAKNTIVGRQAFDGPSPPAVRASRSDWHGESPLDKILEYIKNLPEK